MLSKEYQRKSERKKFAKDEKIATYFLHFCTIIVTLYLIYAIGMATLNTICDCARDYNNWWEFKWL